MKKAITFILKKIKKSNKSNYNKKDDCVIQSVIIVII